MATLTAEGVVLRDGAIVGEHSATDWRDVYDNLKGPVAVGVVVAALAAGLVGWRLTDPTLDWADLVYSTLALFAISFSHPGPVHPLLNVARFLAVAVVYWAAVSVAYRVISRRSPTRRAARLKRHVVVVGDSVEARTIATKYRAAGHEVAVVGALAAEDADQLTRHSVAVVPSASDKELRAILNHADRVVVVGGAEARAAELAERVERIRGTCTHPPAATVLFDHREFAAQWARSHHQVTLCRSTQLAIALLRSHPPFQEDAMVPPPIVIGEGETAAEIARRVVIGWQQPGERITVYCLGRDAAWADAARAGLDHRADLRFVQVPPYAGAATEAVKTVVAGWRPPEPPDRFTVAGPTVYVTYPDVAVTVAVTSAVAEAVENARVIGLVDNDGTWLDTVTPSAARLVSRRALLAEPATLELDPRRLLAAEIVADAARWPGDVPGALGRVRRGAPQTAALEEQDASVRAAVQAVAENAEKILAAGGVRLEQRGWAADPVVLLAPHQLAAVERALASALGVACADTDREARLRRLELAARLPVLAARAGWTPTSAEGSVPVLTTEDLQQLAVLAHGGYQVVSRATDNATESVNFGREWAELSEVDQRSNIAQVADIPVKLATLGLTWQPAELPTVVEFTPDQVDWLAENEHRRWAYFQYRNGRPGHEWNVPWSELGVRQEYDRSAVRLIPALLASVGLEIVPLG